MTIEYLKQKITECDEITIGYQIEFYLKDKCIAHTKCYDNNDKLLTIIIDEINSNFKLIDIYYDVDRFITTYERLK